MGNPHHIEIDLRDGPDESTLTAVLGHCIELLEAAGCTGLDWSLRHTDSIGGGIVHATRKRA